MFDDARSLPENLDIETEVCIVGAGAAGITLAREFINQSFRVLLLESGGGEPDQDTQSLYEGEIIGLRYPIKNSRLRYFGGTTNHWMGSCRPLDDIDFEARDWVPHSGWPFKKSHLVPFYSRAQTILQLGPFAYNLEDWENQRSPRLPFTNDRVTTTVFQHSPPTRFGQVYRNEILQGNNIRTLLYANVVDIEASENARTVRRLRVATLEGSTFWVTAKLFILATGGIENSRLLLLSNTVQRSGLGNQNDWVGRCFMEHQEVQTSVFLSSNPDLSADFYRPHRMHKGAIPVSLRAVLTLSPETMRREKLVNITFDLVPDVASTFGVEPLGGKDTKGVRSFRHLLNRIRQWDVPDDFMQHLSNVIADIDDVAAAGYRKFFGRGIKFFRLISDSEQIPNPESRVTLATERDRLGKNRVRLDWRVSPIERHSINRATEIIGQELGSAGIGRMRITLNEDSTTWGPYYQNHHMGTTRMHVDPKKGVVDEHCRVHGVSNLFIAGSSVFPTSGSAPPTLTIVALALRLAEHVRGRMR